MPTTKDTSLPTPHSHRQRSLRYACVGSTNPEGSYEGCREGSSVLSALQTSFTYPALSQPTGRRFPPHFTKTEFWKFCVTGKWWSWVYTGVCDARIVLRASKFNSLFWLVKATWILLLHHSSLHVGTGNSGVQRKKRWPDCKTRVMLITPCHVWGSPVLVTAHGWEARKLVKNFLNPVLPQVFLLGKDWYIPDGATL